MFEQPWVHETNCLFLVKLNFDFNFRKSPFSHHSPNLQEVSFSHPTSNKVISDLATSFSTLSQQDEVCLDLLTHGPYCGHRRLHITLIQTIVFSIWKSVRDKLVGILKKKKKCNKMSLKALILVSHLNPPPRHRWSPRSPRPSSHAVAVVTSHTVPHWDWPGLSIIHNRK